MEDFRDFGVPRATVDLDIWIEATPQNASRVWAALAAFGVPLDTLQIAESDFSRPDIVVQLGLPPYRIDILTGVSGVSFAEAWEDRVEDRFDARRDLAAPASQRGHPASYSRP